MKQLIETLQAWDFRICGVFIIDAQFMIEASKFVSGKVQCYIWNPYFIVIEGSILKETKCPHPK